MAIIGKRVLSLCDRFTGRTFLVDSGAEVSVLPASMNERRARPLDSPLEAANGTTIRSWGIRRLDLHFGPAGRSPRRFPWHFRLADVRQPRLGADFFA